MKREAVVDVGRREALDTAARLFGTTDALKSYESYEGCQNLVFDYGVLATCPQPRHQVTSSPLADRL